MKGYDGDPGTTDRAVDWFPMTGTGKIQKFRIRQAKIELCGLRAAAMPRQPE
jgi:hypothetical protein